MERLIVTTTEEHHAGQTSPGRIQDADMTAQYPELAGKAAVVTGAARGIGARFVAALAAQGVNVLGADLDEHRIHEMVHNIRVKPVPGAGAGEVAGCAVDVTSREQQGKLAEQAQERFGRLDFWVNNAGIFPEAQAVEIPPSQMRDTLAVNVEGVLYGTQAAAACMRPGSSIVNMASVSAVRVRRGRAAYCSSKAAVQHLTECLAVELGDFGIRVNAIAPGFVDTEMTRWVQDDPDALAHALGSVPLHRLGSPNEIAGPLLFLLSDSARYVTGHTLAVDGGSRHV